MITISIGEAQRSLREASPDWINQQINRRRNDGLGPCVRVRIECRNLNVLVATAGCPVRRGRGRPPNPEEHRVILLWDQRGLNRGDFSGGNLVAFLKQLEEMVGSC